MNTTELILLVKDRIWKGVSYRDIEFELSAHYRIDNITTRQYEGAIEYLLQKEIDTIE